MLLLISSNKAAAHMAASPDEAAMCPTPIADDTSMHSTMMFRDAQMQAILFGIALVAAFCWWLLIVTMPMDGIVICGSNGIGTDIPAWSMSRMSSLLGMWSIMTPAMMLPGAARAIIRASWPYRGERIAYATATSFASGYLLIVLSCGIMAALVQWALEATGTVIDWTTMARPLPGGLLLCAVGLYQLFSPIRRAQPFCEISTARDAASRAAIGEGLRHGRTCFGRCIGMICLQFAGGAMNIGWMMFLTAWMVVEAVLPWTKHVTILAGTTLLVAGGLCLRGVS